MSKKGGRRRRDIWSGGKRVRRVYVHRLVVEEEIGRVLLPTEVVHHINGNAADNRLDNLMVLSSQSAHMFLHHYLWRDEGGIGQLFAPLEIVQTAGEDVIWGTEAGLRAVFGVDADTLLAKLRPQEERKGDARPVLTTPRSYRLSPAHSEAHRRWFAEFRSRARLPSAKWSVADRDG
jgi:hypothetical protein